MEITQLLIFFADTEIFFSYADFSKDENDAQPYVILTRQMGGEQNKRPETSDLLSVRVRYGMVDKNNRQIR